MNNNQKTAMVFGAGGFIGSHLVRRLKSEGYWVRGVDWKEPGFSKTEADEFITGDLSDPAVVAKSFDREFDELYQLAADMGGAGFVFTGEHDSDILTTSAGINVNVIKYGVDHGNGPVKKIFYSSSACMYPAYNQEDPENPKCSEDSAYPAAPDSEYGWEKLFSEHLYLAAHRNYGTKVRIARFHNIFGPEGTWNSGREKAPAAISAKLPRRRTMADRSKFGAMEIRLVHSCTSTNVLKESGAL